MFKNPKIVNFIKGLIIVAVAVLIVTGLSRLLLLKSEDGINQLQALYKQPKESIDVIFMGSSKVYCDISTGVMWDNYGIASFDLGGAESPSWVSYYQLKEALRTQRPKVVCYEVSVAAMYQMLTQSDNWASDNNYGMKWGKNRIDQLKANSTEDEFLSRLIPLNIMHGRYKDLEKNDFINVRNSVRYKGFDPRERVWEMEKPDNSAMTGIQPCTDKEVEYIKKIIELSKSEDIPILLFASPYDIREKDQEILNFIGTIAEQEGVEYIDFNRRFDEIGMDFKYDMADTHHLNYSGNYKFSDYFGSLLKEKYDLPDRRGDSRYSSWEWDSAIQRMQRNDLLINSTEDAVTVLELAKEGYLIFGLGDGKAYIFDDGEVVQEADPGFRMTYRSGDDVFVFEEKNENEYDHFTYLYVNDSFYKEDYGKILYVYDKIRHEFVRSIHF